MRTLSNSCEYCGGPVLTNGVSHFPGCITQRSTTTDGVAQRPSEWKYEPMGPLRIFPDPDKQERARRLFELTKAALTGLPAGRGADAELRDYAKEAAGYARATLAALDKEEHAE